MSFNIKPWPSRRIWSLNQRITDFKLFSFVFFLTPPYLVKVLFFEKVAGVRVGLAAKSSGLSIQKKCYVLANFMKIFGKNLKK